MIPSPASREGVVQDTAPLRTRATRLAHPVGPRWWSGAELGAAVGEGSRAWALLEPVLPASALAEPGQHLSPAARLWRLVRLERGDVGVVVLYAATAGEKGDAVVPASAKKPRIPGDLK